MTRRTVPEPCVQHVNQSDLINQKLSVVNRIFELFVVILSE